MSYQQFKGQLHADEQSCLLNSEDIMKVSSMDYIEQDFAASSLLLRKMNVGLKLGDLRLVINKFETEGRTNVQQELLHDIKLRLEEVEVEQIIPARSMRNEAIRIENLNESNKILAERYKIYIQLLEQQK